MRRSERRESMDFPALPTARVLAIVDAWEARRKNRRRGTVLDVKINVTARNGSDGREASALKLIERWCLGTFRPKRLETDRSRYYISLIESDAEPLDLLVDRLVRRMHDVAQERECDLEVVLRHQATGRIWS